LRPGGRPGDVCPMSGRGGCAGGVRLIDDVEKPRRYGCSATPAIHLQATGGFRLCGHVGFCTISAPMVGLVFCEVGTLF